MRLRRREIRELVFKALFTGEFGSDDATQSVVTSGDEGPYRQLAYIAQDHEMADCELEKLAATALVTRSDYARSLIEGVLSNKKELDDIIAGYSVGWELDRLGFVELCVMRLCLYEMLYGEKLHPAIAINEALNLLKKYSEPEAASFVNGILGKKAEDMGRLSKAESEKNDLT